MAVLDFPSAPTVGQLHPNPMVAGVPQYKWDGTAWITVIAAEMITFVQRTGDTMTGFLTLSAQPTADMHAVPKSYVDGGVADIPGKVSKAGGAEGIMTGLLTLSGPPTAALHAATRAYVDSKVIPSGTSTLFTQAAAPVGWTKSATHNNKALRVVNTAGGGSGGVQPFSTAFGRTTTDYATLDTNTMASHAHNGADGNAIMTGANDYTVSPGGPYGLGYNGCSTVGNSWGHLHGIDIRVQYVDAIICTKD